MTVVKVDRIEVLDGLRGYAVLCVFMVHFAAFHYKNDYFVANEFLYYLIVFFRSHLGVDLFFTISGFLMCLIYFSKAISFQQFYALRLVRLAPAYVAAVLLYCVHGKFHGAWDWGLMLAIGLGAYVFSKTNLLLFFKYFPVVQAVGVIFLVVVAYLGVKQSALQLLIANLLFLQYFFSVPVLMHVSWSLVAELLFYILFFVVKWFSSQLHVDVLRLLLTTVLMALLVQFFSVQYFDFQALNLHRYMAFATGCLLGLVVTKKVALPLDFPTRSPGIAGVTILIALILLERGWIPLLEYFNQPVFRWGYYLAAAIIFLFLVREAMLGYGPVYFLFKNRVFMALGKVSYSFYLLHVLVIGILYKLLSPTDENGMLLHLLLSIGVTYLIACFFYKTLEIPYFSKRQILRADNG